MEGIDKALFLCASFVWKEMPAVVSSSSQGKECGKESVSQSFLSIQVVGLHCAILRQPQSSRDTNFCFGEILNSCENTEDLAGPAEVG